MDHPKITDSELWLDFLCWESYIKILFLPIRAKKVFYCQLSAIFGAFFPIIQKFTRLQFKQINDICIGEEKINDVSLYELTHLRLIEVIDQWIQDKKTIDKINVLLKNTTYNPVKFKQHLKETAFQHIYRAVEIQVLAEKISKGKNASFLIRYTPLIKIFKDYFGKGHIYYYTTLFSHRLKIHKRRDYNYDSDSWMKKYYCDRFHLLNKLFVTWMNLALAGFLNRLIPARSGPKQINTSARIGVELIKTRIRLGEANDIYWLKDLSIDSGSVCGIQLEEYDFESKEILKNYGIQRYRIIGSPIRIIWLLIKGFDPTCKYLTVKSSYFLKTLPDVSKLFFSFLKWDAQGWLIYQVALFTCETQKWEGVYSQLGIKILWSMYDWDSSKLPKAQALENINGLFAGSHWSIFGESTINQKCYDVLFVWGEYFKNTVFNKFPHLDVFEVGYTTDYYFDEKKIKSSAIKSRYQNKFIITFYDNKTSFDLAFSRKMQIDLNSLIISILDKYENVVLFFKPKTYNPLDILGSEISSMKKYIDTGRIVLFLPDTSRTRVPPAEIAKACDLTIGQGISSAAAESYFAGTVSFHADFTGITKNSFCDGGLNKIVFRDRESLKLAIEKKISGDGPSYAECREFYSILDAFQDGLAYKRTGFVLKKLLEGYQQGFARQDCVKKARNEYNEFVKTFAFKNDRLEVNSAIPS